MTVVVVHGRVDVAAGDAIELLADPDRADLAVGAALVVNGTRYTVTARQPAEPAPGGRAVLILRRDRTTRKMRRYALKLARKITGKGD